MNRLCRGVLFGLIITSFLPLAATAQRNTIDSLQLLLNEARHDSTRADLLLVIGFAYSYRDFSKAEETFDLALAAGHRLGDTLRLARIEAQYAVHYFLGRSINHAAMEHLQVASQLLQKKTGSLCKAMNTYVNWFRVLLQYNTTSTSYNLTFQKDVYYKFREEIIPVVPILEAHHYWLEATSAYFVIATLATINQTPEEIKSVLRSGLNCLYRMEEVYREENYYEGTGLANSYIARYIHFMGLGGRPGVQGNPVDKTTQSKKPSPHESWFPIDWRTCLKLDEVHYRKALKIFLQTGNIRQQGVVYNGLSYKYLERDQYDSALLVYNKARALAYQMNDTRELLHYAQTAPDIYVAKGDYKTAAGYYHQYAMFADSLNKMNNEQTMAALEKSYSIKLKESEIDKLQSEATLQASQQRQRTILFAAGLGFLLVLLGLTVYAYYQRRRSSAQLEKNLELQSLLKLNLETSLHQAQLTAARAQMNPHFVYNSINAIQNLILKENRSEAIGYLNDFSKLTRETLENSSKENITLKEEISFLERYLQLETLRTSNRFTHTISCGPEIDIDFDRIPPMMVQPFVENAIRHGFASNERKNQLDIRFDATEGTLTCIIEDNGIGRKASSKLKAGSHHSMATEITDARLELLQEKASLKHKYKVHIEDLYDEGGAAAGTKVTIAIPIESTSIA